ncbi:MAG TPA: peptidoglycan DD-metalloendopeptidase family protein [Ramlibacter sp.]|jgi:lipoprotein NlpD|uniref:peptidoglycan DD-metalloendopeptidase family protein n=1 Tax=Ramlibacter sp. TaxID=1917967 RepID=UPI002D3D6773|nr:peptidoglycan DD-metalloendopeptidase family protein [Ramlibacter sp.]HZY19385.1 peptidoglycan DD-metalloendopeptidase family protein [Ramlibacter sp.]
MTGMSGRGCRGAALLLVALVLAGCASKTRAPAPVEDRSNNSRAPVAAVASATEPMRPLPGAENAGKPGHYTVRPGDTIIRIAMEHGQSWRDVARWNGLDNPNVIEVGQVLRVVPPAETVVARPIASPAIAASAVPAPAASAAASAPLAPASAASAPVVAASAPRGAVASAPLPPASQPVTSAPAAPASPDDDIPWAWPTAGQPGVLAPFDEVRNKGLDIGGKLGDPVLAAADGRVVYAGAGLRGYGNLIILKHNNTYLTAYAHNHSLLVKEDQVVRRGQKIAEMGSSDADRVKLHFEIRRQGKPVDPARFLPPR